VSVGRVRHRVSQFFHTLIGPFRPVDAVFVRRHLTRGDQDDGLLALFFNMPRAEQHHGVDIGRALERQGIDDGDLVGAALLHDVGKTIAPLRLWDRVVVVLVEAVAPRAAASWAVDGARDHVPTGLRRGFVVRRHHPAWGADLAAHAGASERTVNWIRRHHDPADPLDPLLLALQEADEA